MVVIKMNKYDKELSGNDSWIIINKAVYEGRNGNVIKNVKPYDLSGVFIYSVTEFEIAQFIQNYGFPWYMDFV